MALIGMEISHVWRGHGSAIFIEFGTLSETGNRRDGSKRNPQGKVGLMVKWSWRIQNPKEIVCGSWSDEAIWDENLRSLVGEHVSNCELFGTLPEITVKTNGGMEFLSFSTTDGQPQWALMDCREAQVNSYLIRDGQLFLECENSGS